MKYNIDGACKTELRTNPKRESEKLDVQEKEGRDYEENARVHYAVRRECVHDHIRAQQPVIGAGDLAERSIGGGADDRAVQGEGCGQRDAVLRDLQFLHGSEEEVGGGSEEAEAEKLGGQVSDQSGVHGSFVQGGIGEFR